MPSPINPAALRDAPVYNFVINASGAGANTVVAAVPGYRIVVVQKFEIADSPGVEVTWQSSGGTIICGRVALAANGGNVRPSSDVGLFATLPGEGLVLNLGGAVHVGGDGQYKLLLP